LKKYHYRSDVSVAQLSHKERSIFKNEQMSPDLNVFKDFHPLKIHFSNVGSINIAFSVQACVEKTLP